MQDRPIEAHTDDVNLFDDVEFSNATIDHLVKCMEFADEQANELAGRSGKEREEAAKHQQEAARLNEEAFKARRDADQWRMLIAFARARQQDSAQARARALAARSSAPDSEQAAAQDEPVVVAAPEPTPPNGRPMVGPPPYRLGDTTVMPPVPGAADLATQLYRDLATGPHLNGATNGTRG
ncbi:hypothetical protein [Sphaerisporangium sp. NPDC051011]|uniref:hypothetical protein n=1 Tax=Sphaerisporangium sp. NPDC051011 TaxID=3155792 RepID=UPI0033F6178F